MIPDAYDVLIPDAYDVLIPDAYDVLIPDAYDVYLNTLKKVCVHRIHFEQTRLPKTWLTIRIMDFFGDVVTI